MSYNKISSSTRSWNVESTSYPELHANLNHNPEVLFLNHVEIAFNFILIYKFNKITKDLI